jgi:hypothetical protein
MASKSAPVSLPKSLRISADGERADRTIVNAKIGAS